MAQADLRYCLVMMIQPKFQRWRMHRIYAKS
jgi:hypothetical protein